MPGFEPTPPTRNELVARLRGVEARGELWLDYQPMVELADGAVVGLEALVRWQPPDGRLLMPDQFITLAEQTGDIVPMGRWILREACRQACGPGRSACGRPTMSVGVNLSARQFQEHDLVETVRSALADAELEPSSLVLEITESGLMHRTTGDDRPAHRPCARSASTSPSTTSGPATRRSATWSASRSTA